MRYPLTFVFILASVPASAVTFSLSTFLQGSYANEGVSDTQVNRDGFPVTSVSTDSQGTHYVQVSGVNTADNAGNFHFQNGGVATGWSNGTSTSVLFVTVTNNTQGLADLRLDSQITPGHLAARSVGGAGAGSQALFAFGIQQYNARGMPIFPALYTANATLDQNSLSLTSASATFNALNGLNVQRFTGAITYDWSATDIAVDLGSFAAGETRFYQYQLSTSFLVNPIVGAALFIPPVCNGVQVSFGDPRHMGGVGGGANAVAAARSARPNESALPNAANCDAGRINPIIGLPFGDYTGALINVVDASTPLPGQPKPDGPINYNFVPEPAAVALLGFGVATLAARRKRG